MRVDFLFWSWENAVSELFRVDKFMKIYVV
jgi:hypothetical protein